jgi:hypothetical protein
MQNDECRLREKSMMNKRTLWLFFCGTNKGGIKCTLFDSCKKRISMQGRKGAGSFDLEKNTPLSVILEDKVTIQ